MRYGRMSTLAMHSQDKPIGAGEDATGTHANTSKRIVADEVQADNAVHTLHCAFLDHRLSSTNPLFCRLEDKLDVACQFGAALTQNIGYCQQNGGMPIVSTGMHLAIYLGAIINLIQFIHWQRI